MTTKTYALRGDTVDATYIFKAGKTKVRAHFQGGVPDERRRRPATLTTSNQVAMVVIEQTPMFKSGAIYILSQNIDEGERDRMKPAAAPAPAKETKKSSKKVEEKSYPDATSLGQAVNILTDLGANAEDLLTPAAVLETAAQMKVSFPNLSLK